MTNSSAHNSYQRLFTFQDKKMDAAARTQYHLSIYIRDTCFKICCVDLRTTKCLLLEEYKLAYPNPSQYAQAIEQIYRGHPLLGGHWGTVTLCVGNQQYTIIPQHLLKEERLADYLGFMCPLAKNTTTRHFVHPSLHVAVVFSIDTWLLRWIQTMHGQTSLYITHQANSLIQGACNYLENTKYSLLPTVLVCVEAAHLHIIVMQKHVLRYYNRFAYTQEHTWLHYMLTVMHALKLDTRIHEVILVGQLTTDKKTYRAAQKYIRRRTLMRTLPGITYKSNLSSNMMATHLDVMSVHLCH